MSDEQEQGNGLQFCQPLTTFHLPLSCCNRYAYALNNPTTLTDPTGLDPDNPLCGDLAEWPGGSYEGSAPSTGDCSLDSYPFIPPTFPPIGVIVSGGGGTTSGSSTTGSSGGACNGEACPPNGLNWPIIGAGIGAGFGGLVAALGANSPTAPGNTGTANPAAAACTSNVLNAVNRVFGTNFGPGNIQGPPFFNPPLPNPGAGFNLVISATNLSAAQFNAIVPGRFPLNPITYLTGYGPTLHVTAGGPLDPNAIFSNSNVGGITSVLFTAHLDSAFAYNPIGAFLHWLIDVLGIGRNPCP